MVFVSVDVLLLFDLKENTQDQIISQLNQFKTSSVSDDQTLIAVFNKSDDTDQTKFDKLKGDGVFISAKDPIFNFRALKKLIS